jgi:hypothetical protein
MTTPDPAAFDLGSQPSTDQILAARQAAGHTQAQAAATVGLSGGIRWAEYERGGPTGRRIDSARWALYLLLTDQHPAWRLAKRRKVTRS